MLAMLCLAEARGYGTTGAELNMVLPTTFRAPVPSEVSMRRPLNDREIAALESFVGEHWPWWVPELQRGIEQGGCHGAWATDPDQVLGFACHSVNRAGWVGPMGTDPFRRPPGTGSALLGEICRDLMAAGVSSAEIAWVGPVRFYAKAGAAVSRAFRTFSKRRP
jgi:mycothiol synthase